MRTINYKATMESIQTIIDLNNFNKTHEDAKRYLHQGVLAGCWEYGQTTLDEQAKYTAWEEEMMIDEYNEQEEEEKRMNEALSEPMICNSCGGSGYC